jgi:predicted SAM-dependent methyltransferase
MDAAYLDLSSARDWDRFFRPHSIAAILAEHVWEHLTPEQGLTAAKMCYRYLRAGGHLRIAVPDGFPPDPTYINWVRVGGVGDGADDHKVLYTYATLSGLLRTAGFDVTLQEYFDERGTFHGQESDRNDGSVRRSKRYDPRNAGGDLKYTSIIIDGCVPEGAGEPAVP